ncbi:MAG: SLC13 family permease [Woeseiaceae bacterium]|nr:SLC13 family permease [Woeseiaceae bacterium]
MQTIAPDAHGIGVLLLIVVALFLFTRERLPLETSSLFVLIILIVGFQLFPYEGTGVSLGAKQFLSGFGNEALIAVCALIIVGKALATTGALQPIATFASRTWSVRPRLAFLMMLVSVAVMSGFVNDTPIVVLMIPILAGIAVRAKISVSKVMLPMGLVTIIGGMATPIGTSTNLLVISIAHELGLLKIGMFDFVLPVLIVGGAGLIYVWLVVPRLLPAHDLPIADTSMRIFSAQLLISKGSFADGKTLSGILARTSGQMRVAKIQRSETVFLARMPFVKIEAGDRLFVMDSAKNLKEFEHLLGATLQAPTDPEHPSRQQSPFKSANQQLAEIIVQQGSPLFGRTLTEMRIDEVFGVLPLAIHRTRQLASPETVDLFDTRFRAGDVLLLQGSRASIQALRKSRNLLVLDGSTDLPPTHKAKRSLVVMVLVVLSAALGLVPIAVSALVGVGLLLVLGCLSWRDTASSLPIPVIMIIATSLALGKALVGTGMAAYLASGFVSLASGMPTPIILSAFLLIMSILTNIVSNNAAAVIGTPIAIATAQQLGADPMAFVLAVLFGANMSFATPFGYQTNLLVMSAGGYTFSDFFRVGVPLIVLMWLGFSIVLPMFYNLGQ